MQLTELKLSNFRKFSHFELKLNQITIITGANGSGKTSILEAIHTLSLGLSFHTRQTTPLVKIGQKQFTVFAKIKPDNNYNSNSSSKQLGITKNLNGNTERKVDHQNIHSQNQILKLLPIIAITPQKLNLLKQQSNARRNLIDWGVYYNNPEFINYWRKTKKVLKQRNQLLKQKAPYQQMKPWDQILTQLSEQIDKLREQYSQTLLQHLKPKLEQTFPNLPIKIKYFRGWAESENYKNILDKNLINDYKYGFTHAGIHKADLKISVHGHPASQVLSQGQQKTLASLLFLAQANIFSNQNNKSCILLLDDINSELDPNNISHILNEIKQQNHQIILTALSQSSPIIKLVTSIFKEAREQLQLI